MPPTLKDRILEYEKPASEKFLIKVPVIIIVNGRSFSKVTSLIDKPFSTEFLGCMASCLEKLVQEIDGAVFGYSFNDEIVIIARNDQTLETVPWYDNNIQKMVSAAASLVTLQFNNYANSVDMNLHGDAVFLAKSFIVGNIPEAINVVVSKQQQAFHTSIQYACLYEMLKKYNKNDIKEMLSGNSNDEKIALLQQECGVDFNEYPVAFRRGVACYRAPTVVNYAGEQTTKHKWVLDVNIPIFTKEHSFLGQILKAGSDIIRKDSF